MKRTCALAIVILAMALTGCSSEAPQAPIGLDKRPANPLSAPVADGLGTTPPGQGQSSASIGGR